MGEIEIVLTNDYASHDHENRDAILYTTEPNSELNTFFSSH